MPQPLQRCALRSPGASPSPSHPTPTTPLFSPPLACCAAGQPGHGRTIRNSGEHKAKNPVGTSGALPFDPKEPLNTDDITVDTPVASPTPAAEATPAVPEPKTQTLAEYEAAKAGLRQGALFAVVEEDKSALEAQFKGKPVS